LTATPFYVIIKKNKGDKIMRFRVVRPNYFPTYFRTRRDAIIFQKEKGGIIERKIGGNWVK
jgi:hypothetical protein